MEQFWLELNLGFWLTQRKRKSFQNYVRSNSCQQKATMMVFILFLCDSLLEQNGYIGGNMSALPINMRHVIQQCCLFGDDMSFGIFGGLL